MMLLFLARGPVLGQSKKEVLKKAIDAYKENPHPAFKGYSVDIHPLTPDGTVKEYYYGFKTVQGKLTKYYYSDNYKVRLTLDSQFGFWNDGEYPYQGAYSTTEKDLYEQNTNMAMPSTCSVPLTRLVLLYLSKKKAVMTDTTIDGESCFRFERTMKDYFDKTLGMNITDRKETIIISWQTGLIREYRFYEKWDGDVYKMDYRFDYLDEVAWQEKTQAIELEFASVFADYIPATMVKEQQSRHKVGDTIQYWHFKQLGGDSIDIRTLNRDYYVLDFWYTSCAPCVRSIPSNNRLDSSIRQYNAAVLGITTRHTNDDFLEAFKVKRNIQYTLFTHPDYNALESHFPIQGYPTYIIVNKEGMILHIQYGIVPGASHQEIEDIIKAEATK